jgi:hypothetical protein
METISHILVSMQSVMPAEVWLGLIGGPVATLVTQKFKKWFALQSKAVVFLTVLLVAFLETAGAYIAGQVTQDPSVLGTWFPIIALSSIGFYEMIAKPIIGVINEAKSLQDGSQVPIAAANAAAAAAAAGILPAKGHSSSAASDAPEFGA